MTTGQPKRIWSFTQHRVFPWVFQDLHGLANFLGDLLFFGAYWRIGFFITDNWTISPRIGVFLAGMVLLTTPIGFWASIPKRHIFTILLATITLFALAKIRTKASTFPPVYYCAIA